MKNIILGAALLGAALALSACAGQVPIQSQSASGGTTAIGSTPVATTDSSDPIQSLATFTLNDLAVADADAVKNNDTIMHTCYPAIEQFISGLPNAQSLTVAGAFSAFQKARDLRNSVNAGVPQYLIMGCGPAYAQVHGDLLNFLAKAGTAAVLPTIP